MTALLLELLNLVARFTEFGLPLAGLFLDRAELGRRAILVAARVDRLRHSSEMLYLAAKRPSVLLHACVRLHCLHQLELNSVQRTNALLAHLLPERVLTVGT